MPDSPWALRMQPEVGFGQPPFRFQIFVTGRLMMRKPPLTMKKASGKFGSRARSRVVAKRPFGVIPESMAGEDSIPAVGASGYHRQLRPIPVHSQRDINRPLFGTLPPDGFDITPFYSGRSQIINEIQVTIKPLITSRSVACCFGRCYLPFCCHQFSVGK